MEAFFAYILLQLFSNSRWRLRLQAAQNIRHPNSLISSSKLVHKVSASITAKAPPSLTFDNASFGFFVRYVLVK
jgi:hypothetical protein